MQHTTAGLPHTDRFETLITGLLEHQFGSCTGFLDEELTAGLRRRLLHLHTTGEMHPAGIGRKFDFQRNTTVRGDVISWIDEESSDPFEQAFNGQIREFVAYLNQTCYTGINAWEFHYAYYEPGSFYKRHLDQFQSDRGRKFSLVTYLNENWLETDGGQLALYLPDGERNITPHGGQAVLFRSEQLEHEVRIAEHRPRLSIAGWLKTVR